MHPPYQDTMDPLGLVHTAAAVVALALGPAIFLRRKGDRLHHRISWTFATTMLVLNGTAFAIYDLFGHWGTFHYAAIASTLTLAMGLLPAITRRPRGRWLEWHYAGRSWSYAGLGAAAVAETLTRLWLGGRDRNRGLSDPNPEGGVSRFPRGGRAVARSLPDETGQAAMVATSASGGSSGDSGATIE